jgi:serine/threonine protein kinase
MTEDRWERTKAIFTSAIDLDPAAREAFVREAAAGDQDLCREVLSLLAADSEETLLRNPVFASRRIADLPTQAATGNRGVEVGLSERVGPYQLLEVIGRGGMGVVYRALDETRGRHVALKALHRMSPGALLRFKQEFRTFAQLTHPHLVTLYEMLSNDQFWCFTMELLSGTTFGQYVGEDAARARLDRSERASHLRQAFAQLASGVAALHAADKLHRDLKPTNVLVTPEGRVVLVDFGLGVELDHAGVYETTQDQRVGSIGYMSPEQAGGEPVSVASDWYSVGVMLYEALTGRLPFTGSILDVLAAKRDRDPLPPASIAANVPADLDALCIGLLHRDPARRPSEADVLRCLSRLDQPPRSNRKAPRARDTFVGRARELAALRDAYLTMRRGRPVVAYVQGQSGAGKTALAQRFLSDVARDHDAIVLTGRCHEQESVPFKALDSLLDSLMRYLRRLGPVEVQALMPRDIRALARVFPVLWQVAAVVDAPVVTTELTDPHELRRRAAIALRELLARLGDRCPLVLFIDDLQWGDMDSASLLSDILAPPDPPVFLGIGCYRTEEADASPFLRYLQQSRARALVQYDEREIAVSELDVSETRELTSRLLQERDRRSNGLLEIIARESAGRPFLVYELIEHVDAAADGLDLGETLKLEDVLWHRIAQLPEGTRTLLEIVAVAGRPVRILDAGRAAGLTSDVRALLPALRTGRLIRTATVGGHESIELYHDRVRQSVISHLPHSTHLLRHRQLAGAYLASGEADAELLALHFDGAGEPDAAAPKYAQAAAAATETLAFDHAAALYRRALACKSWDGPDRCTLRMQLGDALVNAGRGEQAAGAYLDAVPDADAAVGLELRRRAALALLTSGHVDQGLACLRPVLEAVGTRLAGAPWRALLSLLVRRLQLRVRGTDFVERAEAALDRRAVLQLDVGWSAVIGLSLIDPIRGAEFQTRNLLLALGAGEPFRVCRALAVEAGHMASSGATGRAAKMLAEADRLAAKLGRPYATAMVELARGTVAYFSGRWSDAVPPLGRAATTFREQCRGATWEVDTATAFWLWSLAKMGDIAELTRVYPVLLAHAHDRGDLYATTNLSTQIVALVRLAADDPEGTRAELTEAIGRWSRSGYHLQHHNALLGIMPLELYCGRASAAWDHIQSGWAGFSRSLLSRVQDLRIEMLQLRAYSALAIAAASPRSREFLAIASRDARRLRREGLPWTVALSDYILGAAALLNGDRAGARARLTAAVSGFDAVDAHLHAAATRRRLADLIGGDEGAEIRRVSDAWFSAQGVKVPGRLADAFAPAGARQV